jgi:hypothetical protein
MDYSHCPNKEGAYFSPVAPPEYCNQSVIPVYPGPQINPVNTVPEPSGVVLVIVALIAMWIVRAQ